MSSRPVSALREVIEAIGPSARKAAALIEPKLVASGRAVDPNNPMDSEAARNDRAEASSRKVLESIEKGTVEQQKKWNERLDGLVAKEAPNLLKIEQDLSAMGKDDPLRKAKADELDALKAKIKGWNDSKVRLTHAVSAHGKGTEQEGRVLHGHRADEPVTGTPTTVGHDPSNTSGAFTSNQGMLQTFNEAFAQADMISHHGEQQRSQPGADKSAQTLDQDRIATTFETGQALGYNLEATGVPKQTAGRALLPEEIEERRKHITRTEGLRNATVVMDPGYLLDDAGNLVMDKKTGEPKRAGWNIQTAFAHGDAPLKGSSYSNVGEVGKGTHQQDLDLAVKADKADTTRKSLADTRKKLDTAYATLNAAQRRLVEADLKIDVERQKVVAADVPMQSDKQGVVDLAADYPKLDDLGDEAQQHLQELLTIAALAGKPLGEKADRIDALRKLLDEEDEKCYEEADMFSFSREVLADREDHHALLDKAMALCRSLQLKANAQKKQTSEETQRGKDELAVQQQAAALAQDQDVAALKAKEKQGAGELLTLNKETLELRKAKAAREEAHTEAHGPSGTPPATEGYDYALGEYTGDRPDKPPVLTGVDEDFDPLTAHHLYPWNKIKEDLNKALRAQSAPALKALFQFADYKPGADFWTELAKKPPARKYSFAADINVAAQMICWSPRNIFMGPLGEKRSDDPGEELDATYQAEDRTQQTLNTKIAHAMEAQGGVSPRLTPDEVRADLAKPLFDAKLAKLIEDKKKEIEPLKKQVSELEMQGLMAQSLLEVEDDAVDGTVLARSDAAKETAALLQERAKLESARFDPLRKQVEAFKLKHDAKLKRLTPEQVREDLAKASGGTAPVPFTEVEKEVELRRKLQLELALLNEKLAHAPKRYDPADWDTDKEGQKSQKLS